MGTSIKINGYDGHVDSEKVENVMKALQVFANEARYNPVSGDIKPADILLIYRSAASDYIIPHDRCMALRAVVPDMRGHQSCLALFGEGYQEALKHKTGMKITDPEVRAIIHAASPEISISFNNPINKNDRISKSYDDMVRRRQNSKSYDMELVLSQDPDHNGQELPEPDAHWRSDCKHDMIGAPFHGT